MRQTEHAKADILFDGATITAVGPDLSTPAADGRTILRSAELPTVGGLFLGRYPALILAPTETPRRVAQRCFILLPISH